MEVTPPLKYYASQRTFTYSSAFLECVYSMGIWCCILMNLCFHLFHVMITPPFLPSLPGSDRVRITMFPDNQPIEGEDIPSTQILQERQTNLQKMAQPSQVLRAAVQNLINYQVGHWML